MTPDLFESAVFASEECKQFAQSVEGFLAIHASDEGIDRWRRDKAVERTVWSAAAAAGLLGISVPEEYGGAGVDFRFEAIITTAVGHRGADALTIGLHNAVILPYFTSFGTEQQKQAWQRQQLTADAAAVHQLQAQWGLDVVLVEAQGPDGHDQPLASL